jgi:hypothetical protein
MGLERRFYPNWPARVKTFLAFQDLILTAAVASGHFRG